MRQFTTDESIRQHLRSIIERNGTAAAHADKILKMMNICDASYIKESLWPSVLFHTMWRKDEIPHMDWMEITGLPIDHRRPAIGVLCEILRDACVKVGRYSRWDSLRSDIESFPLSEVKLAIQDHTSPLPGNIISQTLPELWKRYTTAQATMHNMKRWTRLLLENKVGADTIANVVRFLEYTDGMDFVV